MTNWWLIPAAIVAAPVLYLAAMILFPQPVCRFSLAFHYRIKVWGSENIPKNGPVLVASNHVTWIDGFLLQAASPRPAKFLINSSYVNLPLIRQLAWRSGLIPVPAAGPHGQKAAIRACQEALDRGEVLVIFPEAQLSRNGLTGTFYRGLEVIVGKRPNVAVVPVFLDNLWGSLFSYSGGRTFRKRVQGLRRTVIVQFGPALTPPITAFDTRQALIAAGVRAFEKREDRTRTLETIDLSLPHWNHPEYGLLAASTADYDRDGIRQPGQKPGTVGQAAPGVALRALDEAGAPLPADVEGRLQALLPDRDDWAETGRNGRVDRDGFVTLG